MYWIKKSLLLELLQLLCSIPILEIKKQKQVFVTNLTHLPLGH